MTEFKEHIEFKFYEVLKHKMNVEDFEKWLYASKELETELPENLYIDLISLNYKSKYVHNELEKLLKEYVNYGNFEIKKLKNILLSIIERDENCAESIEMTYELYCTGYNFLRRLGLHYGLLVTAAPAGNYIKTWKEIRIEEQNELLNKFYPKIIIDAQNALAWIENGKIIIKNSLNERGEFQYDDLRNEEEIKQGEVEVAQLDKRDAHGIQNKKILKKKQSFWSNLKTWWS
jgi:hypothetical protein